MGRRNTPKWEIGCLQNPNKPSRCYSSFSGYRTDGMQQLVLHFKRDISTFPHNYIPRHFNGMEAYKFGFVFHPWHPNILPRSLEYLLLLAHWVCQHDAVNVMDQCIPYRRKGDWDPWELNDTDLKSWNTPEVGQKRHIDGFLAKRKVLVLFINRHWGKKLPNSCIPGSMRCITCSTMKPHLV